MAACPVCGAELELASGVEEGEIIVCDDCGSELEVTDPDSVQEAPQEEDWGEQLPNRFFAFHNSKRRKAAAR
jgi:alpha-aminoadipate carrier protein LysW